MDGEVFSDEVWMVKAFVFLLCSAETLVLFVSDFLCLFCVIVEHMISALFLCLFLKLLFSIYVMGKHNLGFMNGIWFVFQFIITSLY